VSRLAPRRLAQGFARSACAGANAVLAPGVVPLETDAGDLQPVPHPYKACTMSWRQRELARAAVTCFACSHIGVGCRHCERRLSDCAQQLDAIIRRRCSHVLHHECRGAIEDDRIPNLRRKCRRSRRHGHPRPRHVQRRPAAALQLERHKNRQSRQPGPPRSSRAPPLAQRMPCRIDARLMRNPTAPTPYPAWWRDVSAILIVGRHWATFRE
jgi:hypothetical protein